MKKPFLFILMITFSGLNETMCQWATSGNNIYNTNTGNVGIGSNVPSTLLYVAKNMTEPTITVRNLGGNGGATYVMQDNASGANWKFKATLNGGFKIRDHANFIDVITIEPNSFANAIYIKTADNIGIGTSMPHNSAVMDVTSNTKGFLPPRMTNVELQAIPNPADGLIVYCMDCGSNGLGALSIFMDGFWYNLSVNNCTTIPSTPTQGAHVFSETQIIWNWNTVTGAEGYNWNTVNFFATAEDMGSSTTKTETGLTGNTTYTRYVWAYNACGNSISTTLTSATNGEGWYCGNTLIIDHVAGAVAPVNKAVSYGTVTGVLGTETKCWITSNLGADHQATTVSDATEESAGWYWQFNRMQGYKHAGSTSTPAWSITFINENSDWLTENDPCHLLLGIGWRLPTNAEWNNVLSSGGWTNWNGPWNSVLKMHAAGYIRRSDGILIDRGIYGFYWSSSQGNNTSGWALFFHSGNCNISNDSDGKAYGFSSRCIRD
jgi:uncharacterized protein (TIGR02145 family)